MIYPKNMLPSRIFRSLRDRIVYLEYPPGMSLDEKQLCAEFKVSRTPLREAIRKLEEMGLVSAIPRYGTYVRPVDINEIRCAFEVKIKLEGLAGALAAKRITRDKLDELKGIITKSENLLEKRKNLNLIELDARFHEIIYQSTQNPILHEFLENLHSRCARLWGSSLNEVVPESEVISQLKEVYRGMKNRDPEKTAQLMEDHVQYFIDKIKMQLL